MIFPSNKNWKELNAYKANLKLTQEQHESIVGGLLGDFSLRKIGKYSRLVFEQKNKDYLFHLYDIFKPFVRTPPKERLQKRLNTSEIKSTWYFSTISHPELENYYNWFYPKGQKRIPNDLIDYLTPHGIAYWYMDDGSKYGLSYKISTCSFSWQEHELLKDIFQNKWDITTEIRLQKKYPMFYITKQNTSNIKFKQLIDPYILSSMKYKL